MQAKVRLNAYLCTRGRLVSAPSAGHRLGSTTPRHNGYLFKIELWQK